MNAVNFDIDDPILARVAWMRLAEPGDLVCGSLLANLGPVSALRWLLAGETPAEQGGRLAVAGAKLEQAAAGWRTRVPALDPQTDLEAGKRIGAHLLTPDDSSWPGQLGTLGAAMPIGLWVRGERDLASCTGLRQTLAIVGARAATAYGEQLAARISAELAEQGVTVVSGGAYGIDAAAHRGALSVGQSSATGKTIAFLACGIDRWYPLGNTNLLREVASDGAVVSELPPGSAPYRSRFLARNRLIASLAGATVVVEAAWRSGALSTARQAADLLRPVGAFPGPVTSIASGGCHQLVRNGIATLVTDTKEVLELLQEIAPEPASETMLLPDTRKGLTRDQNLVLDALPVRRYLPPGNLTDKAGLPLPVVLGAMGILAARGLAETNGLGWRRSDLPER